MSVKAQSYCFTLWATATCIAIYCAWHELEIIFSRLRRRRRRNTPIMPLRNLFFLHFVVTFTPTGLTNPRRCTNRTYMHRFMERCQSKGGCPLTGRPSSSSTLHTDWSVLVKPPTLLIFPTRTRNTAAVTLTTITMFCTGFSAACPCILSRSAFAHIGGIVQLLIHISLLHNGPSYNVPRCAFH